MDPDMVRQQEEAEEESRLNKLAAIRAQATAVVNQGRTMFHQTDTAVEPPPTQDKAPHTPESASYPLALRKAAPAPERIGWFASLRAALYCLVLAGLGLLGGLMIGIRAGLFPGQTLVVGAMLSFALGWYSAFASLRANKRLAFFRALMASFLPAAIVVAGLIASMIVASWLTGITPETLTDGHLPSFWMIVGGGGLLAVLLATSRLRKTSAR